MMQATRLPLPKSDPWSTEVSSSDSADGSGMDEFGYLAVILSIILGLSVTQLLQGRDGRPLLRGRRSEDRGQRSEERGVSPSIGLVSTAACALCTIVTAAISTIPAMTWCQCKAAWKNPQVMHTAASVCIISK